jgi:hypothetical protein
MAAKREEFGAKPDVHFLAARASAPAAAAGQVGLVAGRKAATIVIGNAGLQFPMDADTTKSTGKPSSTGLRRMPPAPGRGSNDRATVFAGVAAEMRCHAIFRLAIRA